MFGIIPILSASGRFDGDSGKGKEGVVITIAAVESNLKSLAVDSGTIIQIDCRNEVHISSARWSA
jgi:hypothetical protein